MNAHPFKFVGTRTEDIGTPTDSGPYLFPDMLSRVAEGDSVAWTALNNKMEKYLMMMAAKNLPAVVRGQINPSDLVQQTLVEVVKGIDQFKGESAPEFYAWVTQILRHQSTKLARDWTRKKRDVRRQISMDGFARNENESECRLDVRDPAQTPRSATIAREQVGRMEQALGLLSEEHRTVIQLRNLEELSFKQIAEQMGRSEGAVSKLWYRALVKLRDVIARLEDGNEQA